MIRCSRCVMPDTRPDTEFVDGVCSACIAYERRPTIHWERRQRQLTDLLDRHHGECIVPSSGGKDSTYQVLTLLALGARVTVVTASTCHLTPIGRANIDNLKRFARTIEYSPNARVRATLNRLGLTLVGDISWPEHVSIFTTPFEASHDLRIPLIFYGENPQNQYGGPLESQAATEMTRRWVTEFGGFLGLRAEDLVGMHGLTERDLEDYWPHLQAPAPEAHFLGQYIPWDSHRNATVAMTNGMEPYRDSAGVAQPPTAANLWPHENLDNAQTGIHDHAMYRKYGYGRGCAQASVDVRTGLAKRDEALAWVLEHDGRFPYRYAGVDYGEVLHRIGLTDGQLWRALENFTNWDLFPASHRGSQDPRIAA
jgi:hypothetical protein